MAREKLELTSEQGRELLWEDNYNFITIEDTILDTSRWAIRHKIIIQRKSDGKYFMDHYRVGATEQQDESPWEYDKPNFEEVFPTTKTITVYE